MVELAPAGTDTPLFRGEFEKEMKGQKWMDVQALVKKAISGIESGKTEIRPGLSHVGSLQLHSLQASSQRSCHRFEERTMRRHGH